MTLMKKILLGGAFFVTFVFGVAVSDVLLHTLNSVFDKEIFKTRIDLEARLTQTNQELQDSRDLVDLSNKQIEKVSEKQQKRQETLDKLVKEVDSNINPGVIKDILLTTPASKTGEQGRIFLQAGAGENLLQPTTTGDPTIDEFKTAFNKKAQDIIDVSRGILGEKLSQVDSELVRTNSELKDRNVQLIKKLAEVEKYKQELDQHREQINSLEGIKVNLEKTVGMLETKIEAGKLRVNFQGDILFASGSFKLREEGKALLQKVAPILAGSIQNHDIFIAGHTDNVPVSDKSAKYESNWDLSTFRAIEVVKYLTGKGIKPQFLTAAGYGEFKPISANDSMEGKAKNRRVELYLIPKLIKRAGDK